VRLASALSERALFAALGPAALGAIAVPSMPGIRGSSIAFAEV
jgi:hypothetical protein